MPWTTAHVTSSAGGVDFGARRDRRATTTGCGRACSACRTARTVSAVAPAPGSAQRPGHRVDRRYAPGSNPGNPAASPGSRPRSPRRCRSTRMAGGGPVPSELPADAFRLRVATTGALVPAKAGFPRIVPYNPEAGEHVVAFQPAADLRRARATAPRSPAALVDAEQPAGGSRTPGSSRTSGCRGRGNAAGARHRDVRDRRRSSPPIPPVPGAALARLDGCAGGQDGRTQHGAALPIAAGVGCLEHPVRRRRVRRVRRRWRRDDHRRRPVGGRGRSRHRDQPRRAAAVRPARREPHGRPPVGRRCPARCSRCGSPSTRRRAPRRRTSAAIASTHGRTTSWIPGVRTRHAPHAGACGSVREARQAFMRSSSGSNSGRLPTRSTRTGNSSFRYMTRSSVPSTACSGGRYASSRY